MTIDDKIKVLQRQIEALPNGYISQKTINGKVRYYLQWSEDGKKKSKYTQGYMLSLKDKNNLVICFGWNSNDYLDRIPDYVDMQRRP